MKNDPVLAVVEIDNESSLLQAWQTGEVDANVLGAYQTELQRQWNVYLATQYPSTSALLAAWGASQPTGPQLLTGTWQAEFIRRRRPP